MTSSPADPRAVGTAVACYTLWGVMPLLFMGQAAVGFDALEILAHRAPLGGAGSGPAGLAGQTGRSGPGGPDLA